MLDSLRNCVYFDVLSALTILIDGIYGCYIRRNDLRFAQAREIRQELPEGEIGRSVIHAFGTSPTDKILESQLTLWRDGFR